MLILIAVMIPQISNLSHLILMDLIFNLNFIQNKGEIVGANLMRKHFSGYIKGFPGAAKYRQSLVTAPTIKIMKNELINFRNFTQTFKNKF